MFDHKWKFVQYVHVSMEFRLQRKLCFVNTRLFQITGW